MGKLMKTDVNIQKLNNKMKSTPMMNATIEDVDDYDNNAMLK